ncbi:hypothetical protein HYPSUDRAFT_206826 [Hypholoma sublateritium FD-334 SS-4]|uniref:Uncharacterized protein n=1 Tax=Hypholoma sublateritium (strain FD-334 SS-4) TaxID=945553 RepID=A0A0D2NJL4_HYPSF|nr:hypothetical protein HYPSUDRAFT_206826 [Hypholoma sublateritium FD-334 SS-4]
MPAVDPIHAGYTPTEFKPIEPPLDDSEITFIADHFKPGTIIASEGIKVVKHSTEPLDASFYSKKREGGILILPRGASRQDMTATDRLYEYVQRNAPHWYQVVNGYSDYAMRPNGSLVIVTGCDKAADYANASFSNTEDKSHRISLRYTWKPNYDLPWTRHDHADVHWFQPYGDDIISASPNQCVFVRTLRVSLSSISWAKALPPTSRFVSFIVKERSQLQRFQDIIAAWRKTRYREKELHPKIHADCKYYFEPNIIIAQFMLCQFPNANASLVDDLVWCSRAQGGLGTASNIIALVNRVLDAYEVVENRGKSFPLCLHNKFLKP